MILNTTSTSLLKEKIYYIGVGLSVLLLNWLFWFGGLSLLVHKNLMITPVHSIKQLLMSCVISPVMEELLFRDGLIPFLTRFAHFKTISALLFSSVLFALLHGHFLFFLYFLMGGLTFGIVKIISHDNYSSILLHLLFNSSTFVISLLFQL